MAKRKKRPVLTEEERYKIWKGEIGPGKLLREIIKRENEKVTKKEKDRDCSTT